MASRFWVGGAGNWDATTTTNWSATNGGAGGASVPTAADDVTFNSNSGAGTITVTITAPANALSLTVNKSAITLLHNAGSTVVGAVTLTLGTLNTNGQTCSWGSFSSTNASARTLTLGASQLTLTGTLVAWDTTTVTSLVITANTATITFSGASTISSGTLNFNGASIVATGLSFGNASGLTVANFTRTGTVSKSCTWQAGTITVTGTLTITGNSVINRMLVWSAGGVGSPRTVTAAVVVASNCDFMDITGAGAGNWNLSAIAGKSGDCQGNSGITFTTPATQTATGTVSFNWSTHGWTTRVPLPQDNVVINNAFAAGQTIAADMPRLGKNIDFTGVSGPVVCPSAAFSMTIFGSLTLTPNVSWTNANQVTFGGRAAYTVTSAGSTFNGSFVTLAAPGGTYTLQDGFVTVGTLSIANGTFVTNNQSVTLAALTVAAGATLTLGTTTCTLTSLTLITPWSILGTVSAAAATIVMTAATALDHIFAGGGNSYSTLTYTVANSPGRLVIQGANTFGTLNVGPGRVLVLPSSSTTSVSTWNVSGVPNPYEYLAGVVGNYASTPDSVPLSIVGDIDIRIRVSPDHWVSGVSPQGLVCKWGLNGPGFCYSFSLTSTGALSLITTPDNTTIIGANSTASVPGVVDGQPMWLRATVDVDNGSGGSTLTYYTAPDSVSEPTVWTQLGTTRIGVVTTIIDGTSDLVIGADTQNARMTAGKIYRALVRNGIGGSIVFDADFTAKAFGANSFVESSTNAATVSMIGPLAQAGDGRVLVNANISGTQATLSKASGQAHSDYVTLQDIATTGGAIFDMGVHSRIVSNVTGWGILYEATVAITAAGSIGVTGLKKQPGSVAMTGAGAINAPNVQRRATATCTLGGVGTLTAVGINHDRDSAILTGSGTIVITAILRGRDSSTLLATGTLLATALAREHGTVALAGAGTLAAVGTNKDLDSATLLAQGTLTAVAIRHQQATVNLVGAGSLTAVSRRRLQCNADFSASGTLSPPAGSIKGHSSVFLDATASLTVVGKVRSFSQVTLTGQGTLVAAGSQYFKSSAVLSGQGLLDVTGIVRKLGTATLVGVGSLEAFAYRRPGTISDLVYFFSLVYENWVFGEIEEARWFLGDAAEQRWIFGKVK